MTQVASKPSPTPGAGLEGVVAAKSGICFIDGIAGRLVYRGYEIADLVENASFDEVAHLLWDGKLPNRRGIANAASKDLGSGGAAGARVVAAASPAGRRLSRWMRCGPPCSALAAADPDLTSNAAEPSGARRCA